MNESVAHGPRKRSVLILYGTETGNAQEVAEELGAVTERLHFVTRVSELDNFHPVEHSPVSTRAELESRTREQN